MPKRKSSQLEIEPEANSTLRRSTRHKAYATANAVVASNPTKSTSETQVPKSNKPKKAMPKAQAKDTTSTNSAVKTPKTDGDDVSESSDRWYWLMKAEPQTRLENGIDVKFSIDDLASRTDPEPWDGIRAYAARNNLRAMKKGEMAFFYHSNCKEPGIVGTMEIVREHSPDESAHDPGAPYYDPSSKPEDPKWSVVHVKFHSKFVTPIGLKELREMGKPGMPLENMQMLKQSRLSVSRVSPSEWEHVMDLVRKQGGEAPK
ncbi:PUA-like domain-containing protein [Xylaria sp. CBS 124048]|nr:PUA-like domain-containing protein [Xylaria sp. CBS 124048]